MSCNQPPHQFKPGTNVKDTHQKYAKDATLRRWLSEFLRLKCVTKSVGGQTDVVKRLSTSVASLKPTWCFF